MSKSNSKRIRITATSWQKTYELNVKIDFSHCSEEQLREWAARERIIALQRVLRNRGEAYVAGLGGQLAVRAEEIGQERASIDTLVQKLSEEEKQRLLAMLQQK